MGAWTCEWRTTPAMNLSSEMNAGAVSTCEAADAVGLVGVAGGVYSPVFAGARHGTTDAACSTTYASISAVTRPRSRPSSAGLCELMGASDAGCRGSQSIVKEGGDQSEQSGESIAREEIRTSSRALQ